MKKPLACFLMFFMGAVPAFSINNLDVAPPGNWAKVELLAAGADISVKMVFGNKMEGTYVGLDTNAIRLRIGGQDRIYPRKDVAAIRLLNLHDSSLNGTLWGLGIGAVSLSMFGGIMMSSFGGQGDEITAITLVSAGIGGGIGALVEYAIDKTHKGSELIYRAPVR
jgi:hypothetical protein